MIWRVDKLSNEKKHQKLLNDIGHLKHLFVPYKKAKQIL